MEQRSGGQLDFFLSGKWNGCRRQQLDFFPFLVVQLEYWTAAVTAAFSVRLGPGGPLPALCRAWRSVSGPGFLSWVGVRAPAVSPKIFFPGSGLWSGLAFAVCLSKSNDLPRRSLCWGLAQGPALLVSGALRARRPLCSGLCVALCGPGGPGLVFLKASAVSTLGCMPGPGASWVGARCYRYLGD